MASPFQSRPQVAPTAAPGAGGAFASADPRIGTGNIDLPPTSQQGAEMRASPDGTPTIDIERALALMEILAAGTASTPHAVASLPAGLAAAAVPHEGQGRFQAFGEGFNNRFESLPGGRALNEWMEGAQASGREAGLPGGMAFAADLAAPGPGELRGMAHAPDIFSAMVGAFHGSPHRFSKFDSKKIGTGEGAQSYGHGLYFAENPKVAGEYHRNLADVENREIAYGGELLDDSRPDHLASQLAATNPKMSRRGAAATLRGEARVGMHTPETAEQAAKLFEDPDWQPMTPEKIDTPGGGIYAVDIDVEHADLLDWDVPLSEQGPKVQKALREDRRLWVPHEQYGNNAFDGLPAAEHVARQIGGDVDIRPDPSRRGLYQIFKPWEPTGKYSSDTGQDFYEALTSRERTQRNLSIDRGYSEAAQNASEALREAGIPGIRYYDAMSRTDDAVSEATHEVVNFAGHGWTVQKKGEALMDTSFPAFGNRQKAEDFLSGAGRTSNVVIFPGEEGRIAIKTINDKALPEPTIPKTIGEVK